MVLIYLLEFQKTFAFITTCIHHIVWGHVEKKQNTLKFDFHKLCPCGRACVKMGAAIPKWFSNLKSATPPA